MPKHDSDPAALAENALEKLKKHYSKIVVEHCLQPRNFKRMNAPDGYTKYTGADGDMVEIFLQLDDKCITECTFQTDGCAATLACGSIATELITGKLYADALAAVCPEKIDTHGVL